MDIEKSLNQTLADMGTTLGDATDAQIFCALLRMVRDLETGLRPAAGDRKLYYFSAEFLVGRLLRANLVNLGLADEVERVLAAHGTTLAAVEDCEPGPSPRSATAGWGGSPRASLTPSPHWGFPETAWASTTTTASSGRTSPRACSARSPTPGSSPSPG